MDKGLNPWKVQIREANFNKSIKVLLDVVKISVITGDLGRLRNILKKPLLRETDVSITGRTLN
jgi:hypothetical protein